MQRCRHHALLYSRVAVHDLAGSIFGFGAEDRKSHRIFIGIQGAAHEDYDALCVEVLEICKCSATTACSESVGPVRSMSPRTSCSL